MIPSIRSFESLEGSWRLSKPVVGHKLPPRPMLHAAVQDFLFLIGKMDESRKVGRSNPSHVYRLELETASYVACAHPKLSPQPVKTPGGNSGPQAGRSAIFGNLSSSQSRGSLSCLGVFFPDFRGLKDSGFGGLGCTVVLRFCARRCSA